MTQSDAELLRSGYEAFAGGDVPAVLALFSEDIAWHVSGRSPIAGDYRGHDEVLGFFGALGERSNGTFKLDVQQILDSGDGTVVALVTETAHREGARLDVSAVHVWQLREGKATSFRGFMADDYAVDEFWS
ncbi:MAG: nuclear transport factor 2 family protein [Actinomycetota bacterium]|nr:nuclear transport factor 2 family protein [Actinomycetota bacterium]